jgi:hypothetical protein
LTHISPAQSRTTIADSPDGLHHFIPPKRSLFTIAFLIFWLGGWAMGEKFAIEELVNGQTSDQHWFLLFWLGGWTLGGGFALFTVLWGVLGREHIILRHDALVIRRELVGRGRSREYSLSDIRNLRVAGPVSPFDFRSSLQFWGLGGGAIAFDYGASTVRFGASLEEGDAGQVVERLTSRHRFPGSAPAV